MNTARTLFNLMKTTFDEWNRDKAPRLAAALAYYTAFSIAPLLVIVIAVVGLVYGQEAARGEIVRQIQGQVGPDIAQMIQTMIENSATQSSGVIATILGLAAIIFGAAGFFGQLQDALNTVWEVTPKPGKGLITVIKERFLSFTMVLGIGFLLLVSLTISAMLASLHHFVGNLLPEAQFITQILNIVLSFGLITVMFAMIYKVLPDVQIAWKDVWVGAMLTAMLFTIGKALLGLYLGNSGVSSTYGVAGSFVVLLLWVYYSAQILLFGAEFTQVYARRFGSQIVPSENAVRVTDAQRAEEGIPRHTRADAEPEIPPAAPEPVPITELSAELETKLRPAPVTEDRAAAERRWTVFWVGLAAY
ncbi:MAG: YihY/virulence factor BrkB family protein, partial [Anaerolineae bacterium]|nr:YihY/virulence factor BrkB family protein [Anaerolineae bacterium]